MKSLILLFFICSFATSLQAGWQTGADSLASGGAYAEPLSGETPGFSDPLFHFHPLYPRNYQVWARVRRGNGAAGNALDYAWNGGATESIELPQDSDWTWLPLGNWHFAMGSHQLEVTAMSPGCALDRLWITPDADAIPFVRGPRSGSGTPATTYETWAAGYTWAAPEDALPGADPDGDGVVNAFERLGFTDPLASTPRVFMELELPSGASADTLVLRIRLAHQANADELAFSATSNLTDWSPATIIRSITRSETADYTVVELHIDTHGQNPFFVRSSISSN